MAIRYYYIDDDPIATIQETARGLSVDKDKLEVLPYQHTKWDDQLDFLIKEQGNYHGLLLDWGLNRKNEKGDEANFDVEALAQQLRKLIIEKKGFGKDFPIVLCSAKYNFNTIFTRELSSHDLFDGVYEKDEFHERKNIVVEELIDYASSYQYLSKSINPKEVVKTIQSILAIDNLDSVDYRVVDHLTNLIVENKPIHEVARFLLNKVVRSTGILINDFVLASRLGVDIVTSKNADWPKLLEVLKSVKYCGAFSVAWSNWWMTKLDDWWNENFSEALGMLNASERVQRLNDKFRLNLPTAAKTGKSKSDLFWVTCKVTNRPIAIEDAIIVVSPIDKAVWEEDQYFSIDCAVQQEANLVHPLERERLKKYKILYTKTRNK